ncbi:MAG: hypothetical protein L3K23_05125 [Thermoplasmata archaeon]|nr:hypothetical protein [Thermoplasmata archaeon]
MGWPAAPGTGPYPLTLNVPAFYLLGGVLAVFGGMLYLLYTRPYGHRRALQGYLEAAGISLVFLVFSFLLVVWLAVHDPMGNRTSRALFDVVLGGVWLTFAIPIVTVGSSVHHRSHGGVPWMLPSVAIAVGLFALIFAVYYGG